MLGVSGRNPVGLWAEIATLEKCDRSKGTGLGLGNAECPKVSLEPR